MIIMAVWLTNLFSFRHLYGSVGDLFRSIPARDFSDIV